MCLLTVNLKVFDSIIHFYCVVDLVRYLHGDEKPLSLSAYMGYSQWINTHLTMIKQDASASVTVLEGLVWLWGEIGYFGFTLFREAVMYHFLLHALSQALFYSETALSLGRNPAIKHSSLTHGHCPIGDTTGFEAGERKGHLVGPTICQVNVT